MQQGGGSQYGVPPTEMSPPPYGISGTQTQILGIPSTQDQLQQNQQQQQAPEVAPPISSRPPAATGTSNLEELRTVMGVCGFPDDVEAMAAGEEAERGISGNRWPRQETLALLKIRSDMDAVFRDATLKGPLWEDVSRKLAEQGYTRSAKKCKEKFENVHKYYKRTKEKSGGRQDGKSYRFYSQLEALNSSTSSPATAAAVALPSLTTMNFGSGIMGSLQPTPLTTLAPTTTTAQPSAATNPVLPQPGGETLFSFSSNTWSSGSSSDSDGEDTEEGLMREEQGQRKRKRGNQSSSGRKMRAFLKELMQQVLERQEMMQKRFFETIEKREQERMIREEAWKRQEMARLNREHELMAQERAMSASRDASIVAFLQNITDQSVQLPHMPISVASTPQPVVTINPPQSQQQTTMVISPPPPPPQQHKATPSQHGKLALQQQVYDTPGRAPSPPVPSELMVSPREQSQELASAMGTSADPASSRWPKMEVHALIKVRSEMEPRYQENGPKGPLWEEISAAMQRMGYNRSSKRCKEKWENINKYFKKVKESSKKRPEDSKTCPYFHQLDALYRKKIIGSSSSGGGGNEQSSHQENDLAVNAQILPITTLPPASQQPQVGNVGVGSNGGGGSGGNSEEFDQMKTSNGDRPQSLSEEGGTGIKKPEDILKELMGRGYDDMEENDSDSMTIDDDDDDDDDDEDEEQQKMAYKTEFQRSDMGNSTATTNNPGIASVTTTTTAGSFLAMVK